jgi:Tfp pilus assembly protein PilF
MLKTLFFKTIVFIGCLLVVGCGKRKNEKLAQNYYKLSMAELSRVVDSSGEELLAYKHALDYINKALEQQQTAEYLAFKATLLLKLARFDDSKKFFKLALKEKLTPTLKGEILNNYACLLAQSNYEQDAFAIWQRLVNDEYYLTPEVAYVNQGRVLASKTEYQQAKNCFLKAIELAPDYLDAHYYLAILAQNMAI